MISLQTVTAFDTTAQALVRRVRLRAARRVAWLRHLWTSGAYESDRGMTISHSDVDRMITDGRVLAAAESEFYAEDSTARAMRSEIERADKACADNQELSRLRTAFELTSPELDLLQLAAAVAIEPGLSRVFGYLEDGVDPAPATVQLAASLFEWPSVDVYPEAGELERWRLVQKHADDRSPRGGVVVDPHICGQLIGLTALDPALGLGARLIVPPSDAPCLFPQLLAEMEEFAAKQAGTPTQIELIGSAGGGRSVLAAQFAARLGRDLVAVDAGELLGHELTSDAARDRVIRVWREARLRDGIPFWRHSDKVDLRLLAPTGLADISIVGLEGRRQSPAGLFARRSFRVPSLTRQDRIRLWSATTVAPVPRVVREWTLTPAEIVQATTVAAAGEAAVTDVCRAVIRDESAELLVELPTPFGWDDIVLAIPTLKHLLEFEAQARLRWSVYEEWGFGRLWPLGRGVSALFSGPSGSGKTMAAQVVARSLGMDLYRIDLAGVVNKYIGETEKRLRQVFDGCERANVVLLFDEADALFGQRTQVKDAHDRFANIEIDYLLQRMEQFDGIAILATNRKGDLDKAFVRRLRFIVDFMQPQEEEREILWRRALPETAPSGEPLLDEIDWKFLANRIVMSAADIKLAALAAAFQARRNEERIGMKHLLAASRRELAKVGIELRGHEVRP